MKKTNKKIIFKVEKTQTGFSAYADHYPVFTTGRTVPELIGNAFDACKFYFEDQDMDITRENMQYEIDLKQFFQHYKVLNTKFLANRIGMHPTLLSQYVNGHKKPSNAQVEKILSGIHQIGKELSEIYLIQK